MITIHYSLILPSRPSRPATVPTAAVTTVPATATTYAACTACTACMSVADRSTKTTSTTSAPSSMPHSRASIPPPGTVLNPAEKPSGCSRHGRGFLGQRLLLLGDDRLCSFPLLAGRCRASGANRIRRASYHGLRDCVGDVPVPLLGQVDWIVLSPQPLAGAGRPFPQTEIAGVREHSWINDIEAKVMFQSISIRP